jgi:hypothetical protein
MKASASQSRSSTASRDTGLADTPTSIASSIRSSTTRSASPAGITTSADRTHDAALGTAHVVVPADWPYELTELDVLARRPRCGLAKHIQLAFSCELIAEHPILVSRPCSTG